MPIGPEILQIGAQLQAYVFFWETLYYLGKAKRQETVARSSAEADHGTHYWRDCMALLVTF